MQLIFKSSSDAAIASEPALSALSTPSRGGIHLRAPVLAKRGLETRATVFAKPVSHSAFTLLEVIIACAIFFMFAFAILELVTRGLNAARSIQHHEPDAALILGPFSTNRVLEVGADSGDFEDLYPGIYPGYNWTREVSQPFGETNPLFQVTVVVTGTTGRRKTSQSVMSVLMFAPDSKLNAPVGGTMPIGR